MKNKTSQVSLWLAITAVVCLAIGGVLILSMRDMMFSEETSPIRVNEERTVSITGIARLEIRTVDIAVEIHESPGDQIRMHLRGNVHSIPQLEPELYADVTGDSVVIGVRRNRNSFFYYQADLFLDVYLPKTQFKSVSLHTTSGDWRIDALTAEEFTFRSVSGNLTLNGLSGTKHVISTTSGNADILGFTGGLNFRSVSGDLRATLNGAAGDIRLKTTSGDVTLALLADAVFSLETSSVSGDIDSQFPLIITQDDRRNRQYRVEGSSGRSGRVIVFESVSGNLDLLRK